MTKSLAWGLVLALVGIAGAASASPEVRAVRHQSLADGRQQIVVQGNSLARPHVVQVPSKSTYILEFKGHLRTQRGVVRVDQDGVASVQFGWYTARPPRVRVAFRLNGDFKPELTQQGQDWVVTFGTPDAKPSVNSRPVATNSRQANPVPPSTDKAPDLPYPTDALPLPGQAKPRAASTPPNRARAVDVSVWGANSGSTTTRDNQSVAPAPTPARSAAMAQLVSLDFVGTDVVQILKALSIQSSVNIIASPEVSPADKPLRLTVSLNRVSLDDALSYITAIAGLRFAKVGNTYIVTPSASFSEAMRQVMERSGNRTETRVVNLLSGQAAKIREATLKAIPPTGNTGFYEIIVPGAGDLPLAQVHNQNAQAGQGGQNQPAGQTGNQPSPAPTPQTNSRVFFLMVVGDSARIGQVEAYIQDIDRQIAASNSLNRKEDLSTVVIPVQSGETGRIRMMLDRLIADHPRAAEFTITESILEGTTKGEAQTMAVLMIGPKEEVAKLESFAKALDQELCAVMGRTYEADLAGLEKVWEVVALQFVEPTILELDLKRRFKGLQISLLPDAVTPGLTGRTSSSEQTSGATGAGGNRQGGAAADGGSEQQNQSQSEERTITGREPLKIVLRGTRSQIDEAKAYIAMVDIAPKQIALELRVMELTREDALRLGLDWSMITGGRLSPIRVNQGLGDQPVTSGTISGSYQFQDTDRADFLATLDQINNGRNLVARPNALVSDGRKANLFVGDTVRYIKTIQSTQSGTTVETGEIQVGVRFDIQARVGGDGQITLALDQNFSILTGFTPVPGGGQLPQTSDRLTNMFVNMTSGETLAIGGLILEQDRRRVSGIPILKDLPIIGQLFSRTDNSKVKTEIVFFLTAKLVDQSNRAEAASPANSRRNNPDPLGDYSRDRAPKAKKDRATR